MTSELKTVLTPDELQNARESLSSIIHIAPFKQVAIIRIFALTFSDQMRICLYLSIFGVFVSLLTWEKNPASVEDRRKLQESLVMSKHDDSQHA